jgi:hypothetical protein
MTRPRGISFDLTPGWAQVARALAQSLRARLILGINLKLNQPRLAAVEARRLLAAVGRQNVAALEIGNEPGNYGTQAWYKNGFGKHVYARRHRYGFRAFTREFTAIAQGIPGVALAGPAAGGFHWLTHLKAFLRDEPRVRIATFHRYALDACLKNRASPQFATIHNLLAPFATVGITRPLPYYTALAHRHGVAFRVDEVNSVACSGELGISDSLAAALWAPDALFAMVRDGVDGVNVHTFPGARYAPFVFTRGPGGAWSARVRPLYYGLALFHMAAPAGSRLLPRVGLGSTMLRAWAVRTPGSEVRLLIINYAARAQRVIARLPAVGAATMIRLQGPALSAVDGLTLGGQHFDSQGRLAGPRVAWRVVPGAAGYEVDLPPASAALLRVRAAGDIR